MNGRVVEEERVTCVADETDPDRFLPQVALGGSGIRPFEAEDMARVLDYAGIPEPPKDGPLMIAQDNSDGGLSFPKFHFCARGGYLFYFDPNDVDEDSGPYAIYVAPPYGVVPLDDIAIEFPPGGRRCFREHAHTDARTGYEMVVVHVPSNENVLEENIRPPYFLVADSLGNREKWAQALRTRGEVGKATLMRGGYSSTSRAAFKNEPSITPAAVAKEEAAADKAAATAAAATAAAASTAAVAATGRASSEKESTREKKNRSSRRNKDAKSVEQQVMDVSDDAELAAAVVEFGRPNFEERAWMDHFFQVHNDFDAPSKCTEMEQWQTEMKKSLKGAVLEQYEYFVQASGEMTTMGREVASLKTLIERQVETIKNMKEIDFTGAMSKLAMDEGRILDPPRLNRRRNKETNGGDDGSLYGDTASETPEVSERGEKAKKSLDDTLGEDATPIEIPEWLDDVAEDVTATVRECRYNDAIEQLLKAKAEIAELLEKHERPTPDCLTAKQQDDVRTMQKKLDSLENLISGRLEENLRRKNEALKQASKRERSDPGASMAPVASPCALKDDSLYLQLLVKLGKTSEAADAYASRRSLLLLETLHERPISGSGGTVDLVIYAAQLSQSFFTCLAISIEGFLDLFLMSQPGQGDKNEDLSLADSSLHSHVTKAMPAGAVASLVLWCEEELSKFASAFGGTRILANLALSPPPRGEGPRKPRVVGGGPTTDPENGTGGNKERTTAISVAAQCIDQALMHASQNLDSVGLPLTPRLAEYIRVRLKGCEAEVSYLLDEKWQQLTSGWRAVENGLPNDDRRR